MVGTGAAVLLLDKAEFPGGTTARSGGGMWIPNNFTLRAQGIADDRDRCVRYMARSAFPAAYRPDHPSLGLSPVQHEVIEAMVADHLRGPVFGGAAAATSTGDFITLAGRVGAQLGNMNQVWWDQVVVEQAAHFRVTSRDAFYAYGDSMIMVNRLGRRALNEKSPYTDRGQAH